MTIDATTLAQLQSLATSYQTNTTSLQNIINANSGSPPPPPPPPPTQTVLLANQSGSLTDGVGVVYKFSPTTAVGDDSNNVFGVAILTNGNLVGNAIGVALALVGSTVYALSSAGGFSTFANGAWSSAAKPSIAMTSAPKTQITTIAQWLIDANTNIFSFENTNAQYGGTVMVNDANQWQGGAILLEIDSAGAVWAQKTDGTWAKWSSGTTWVAQSGGPQ